MLQPTLVLEHGKVLKRFVVHERIMLVDAYREVDLRLDYMIQGFLVADGFLTCFVGVQNVVGTGSNLLDIGLRRT